MAIVTLLGNTTTRCEPKVISFVAIRLRNQLNCCNPVAFFCCCHAHLPTYIPCKIHCNLFKFNCLFRSLSATDPLCVHCAMQIKLSIFIDTIRLCKSFVQTLAHTPLRFLLHRACLHLPPPRRPRRRHVYTHFSVVPPRPPRHFRFRLA